MDHNQHPKQAIQPQSPWLHYGLVMINQLCSFRITVEEDPYIADLHIAQILLELGLGNQSGSSEITYCNTLFP